MMFRRCVYMMLMMCCNAQAMLENGSGNARNGIQSGPSIAQASGSDHREPVRRNPYQEALMRRKQQKCCECACGSYNWCVARGCLSDEEQFEWDVTECCEVKCCFGKYHKSCSNCECLMGAASVSAYAVLMSFLFCCPLK